jgi:hypothetical protein
MGFLSECKDVHSLAFLNHAIIVVTLRGILPIHLQSVSKFALGTISVWQKYLLLILALYCVQNRLLQQSRFCPIKAVLECLKLRSSNNLRLLPSFDSLCEHRHLALIIWRYQWYMRYNAWTWLDWFFSGFYTSDELMQKIWLKKPPACSDLLNCFTSIDRKPCNRIIKRAENQKWIIALF